MKDRTKIMYANELIKMLEEMPFDKVRVVDLTKRCETTPPTFYYHFKDKYELVAWMYLKDFTDVVSFNDSKYTPEKLALIMDKMNDKRVFYKKVFISSSQNSILSYIKLLAFNLSKDALKNIDLNQKHELEIKYHVYGILGLLEDWILSSHPIDTLTLATLMYEKTPEFLKKSFNIMEYNKQKIMKENL